MRYTKLTLAVALAVSLSGCVMPGKPLGKAAPPPQPQPQPVSAPVTQAPAPPAPTLSIPQTTVQLPEPQPVTAEALASTLPTEEPPPAVVPAPKPPPRKNTGTPAPAAATQPATPQEPERAPVQVLVPPGEQNRLREETAASRREAQQRVAQAQARPASRQQRNTLDRIQSFLKQSEDMEQRGNLRQANELAGKAATLARELK